MADQGGPHDHQEADVLLAIAHFTQAAARLLEPDSEVRPRLELLAADLAASGRRRQPSPLVVG